MPFYGLLDEAESEYFRKADEILELDQFGSPDGLLPSTRGNWV